MTKKARSALDQHLFEIRYSSYIAHAFGMGMLAWQAGRLPTDWKLAWAFFMLCLADVAWIAYLTLRARYDR